MPLDHRTADSFRLPAQIVERDPVIDLPEGSPAAAREAVGTRKK